jgi:hypothetical protein
MANRFPGGGNMPQQLLDMLNNGEDIGALWDGILAEIALRGGIIGDANEAAGEERGDVEDDIDVPIQMPGGIEELEEEQDEEEQGDDDDEEESEVRFLRFQLIRRLILY